VGETTLVLLGALAVAGALLVGLGIYARARLPLAVGVGILVAVAGTWVIGLAGIVLGVAAFALLARTRSS
jgi:hypothetical protein